MMGTAITLIALVVAGSTRTRANQMTWAKPN